MNVITQSPAAHDHAHDLRFQAMFEGAAIGIGICQLDGRILEANPALGRMLGYSPQELTDAPAGELYPGIGCRFCSGNGLPGNGLPDECLPDQRLLGELLRGERVWFEIEKCYRRKDGSEFWGLLTVSLGRDERRQPAFLIAMLLDATERRQAEEHLREAEKMEVIGRLAGGVAHDFNNLLTGILLYCDLLNSELETGGLRNARSASSGLANLGLANQCSECLENLELARRELCQHVEEVRMAGEQGAALTQQLLAIARKQAAEPRPISINEIVASMQNLLRRLIGEQIELVTALDSGVGLVLADPAQLRQILLNLVLNARDAMPQGGTIRLITRPAEFPRESTGDFASSFAAHHVKDPGPGSARRAVSLAVKDNGCGMDAETRARLFEPFFTTKKPGKGTGLGLATVQRIVSEAGGIIAVESEPGRGTLMDVFLPAIESAIRTSSIEGSSSKAASSRTSPPGPAPEILQFRDPVE
jgi:two-component system, cell cycle sensor histidine kinase and response regulator CckA